MALFQDVNGQAETRRPAFFRDRHGREYFAQVETKTGDPCQMPVPYRWTAPLSPSAIAGCLVPPADPEIVYMVPTRARKHYQIEIDYARWLEKWDARYEAWQRKRVDIAKANDLDWRTESKIARSDLESVVGPPPFPPRLLIEAAAAGNKWALGLSEAIPPKAEQAIKEAMEHMTTRRRADVPDVDPFAEEGEDETPLPTWGAPDPFAADPDLEARLDLEEQHDPEATGGKKLPKRVKKQPAVVPGEI